MQSETRARWNSLDCLKAIACLSVTVIHFNWTAAWIPAEWSVSVRAMARFAVPVFLAITGFFLPEEKRNWRNIRRKLRQLLGLTAFAAVCYAALTLASQALIHGNWNIAEYMAQKLRRDRVIKLLLTHDPFVYSHLWYLLALGWCYLFVLLPGMRRMKYVLAPALLCGYACMQEFRVLPVSVRPLWMGEPIYLYNSFLFRALPFLLFGMILREQLPRIRRIPLNAWGALALTALGMALQVLERRLFGDCQFYVGSYLVAAALLLYCLKNPDAGPGVLRHVGRDLSMYVYLFHYVGGYAADLVFSGRFASYDVLRPAVVILITLAGAEVLFRLKGLAMKRLRK